MSTYLRQSPLHDLMAPLDPVWIEIHSMRIPKRFKDPAAELESVGDLALCDISALRKMAVAGPGAGAWLVGQGLTIPKCIYDYAPLGDNEGIVIRVSSGKYFLEDGLHETKIPVLKQALGDGKGDAYPVERQDTGFLLCGLRALLVLAQTCSVDFESEPEHLVMSRVAGVSCSILPRRCDIGWAIRIWCAPSFGHYLGEQLLEILKSLDGKAVGIDSVRDIL